MTYYKYSLEVRIRILGRLIKIWPKFIIQTEIGMILMLIRILLSYQKLIPVLRMRKPGRIAFITKRIKTTNIVNRLE